MPDVMLSPSRRGRPAVRWLSVDETADHLDWEPGALRRILSATRGQILPGAMQDDDGTWSVPETALRRLTGAGLFLFSIRTLSELLDCEAETLRRLARAGKLRVVEVPGVGKRVPWAEYQRLIGRDKA
jgi:hypothetical protein